MGERGGILNSGIVEERSYCALFGMIIGGCIGGDCNCRIEEGSIHCVRVAEK